MSISVISLFVNHEDTFDAFDKIWILKTAKWFYKYKNNNFLRYDIYLLHWRYDIWLKYTVYVYVWLIVDQHSW